MKTKKTCTTMKSILFSFILFCNIASAQNVLTGFHYWNGFDDSPANHSTAINACTQTCTKLVRATMKWAAINPSPGVFNWYNMDARINAINSAGLEPVAMLLWTPQWCSTYTGLSADSAEHFAPVDTIAWVTFVDSCINRYKGKIKYWEIWNEQDGPYFVTTIPTVAERANRFIDLLASGYRTIKNVDTTTRVLIGGFTSECMVDPIKKQFLDSLFNKGAKNYFDIMNVHAYVSVEGLRSGLSTFYTTYGLAGKPLWITETNPYKALGVSNTPANVASYLNTWANDSIIAKFGVPPFNTGQWGLVWFPLVDHPEPLISMMAYGILDTNYEATPVLTVFQAWSCGLSSSIPEVITQENITVFPNPNKGQIQIRFSEDVLNNFKSLSLMDSSGKIILESEKKPEHINTINVSDRSPGIYFLTVYLKNGSSINSKVIIQ